MTHHYNNVDLVGAAAQQTPSLGAQGVCVCVCQGQWTREGGPLLLVADAISRQLANQPLTLLKSEDLPPSLSENSTIGHSPFFVVFAHCIIHVLKMRHKTFGLSTALVLIGHLS